VKPLAEGYALAQFQKNKKLALLCYQSILPPLHHHATAETKPAAKATVTADAKILGVHRTTLSRAIHGKISSPELLTRYQDLTRLRARTTSPITPK
jgi:hypothetical protein